ncbi:RDD family protein [Capnocytophaga catalasegens]|uniref:RDD family protein n=1 Tax=Capnocytophaga catalasegens TaxID=1004260 RepID=A0AAV5ASH5_9FLAO|nr:RDD family protein [Capnocytophaga catalasegens]GIZ16467.1 RDD family protein [Capnocytophaga catalasegens]GJM50294.1 RDD family protein [Capnocytophaga catalasegens]GJM53811.1 RDD family protein [Capnocytophaga catalasegens]
MFKLSIKTTQNIPLFFTPASIGERMLAFLIDVAIQSGYIILLIYIINLFDLNVLFMEMDMWSIGAIIIIITAPANLYPLVCESLMSGQTLGKKVMKIRVIKIDGYQASFYDYAIRWVFGIFEIYAFAIVGLFSMMVSKHTQRLGDLVAGVAVISLKNKTNISHTILTEIETNYQPYFLRSQIFAFSDNDVQIIKKYFDQARFKQKWDTIGKLCEKIEQVSHRKNTELTPVIFVEKFLKDYNYYTQE